MKIKSTLAILMSLLFIMTTFINVEVQAMGIGIGIQPIADVEDIKLIINEEEISFNSYAKEPYVIDGITMLPVRAISENLGFDVGWIGEERSVFISKDDFSVKFSVDEDNYTNNAGQSLQLGIKPVLKEGRTLLPSDFFTKVLGAEVIIEGSIIKVNGHINWEDMIDDTNEYYPIVVDVPTNYMENNFYEYSFDIVDAPIKDMDKAIRVEGNNHSDDMFMGFYRKIDGLKPNFEYIFKFSMDLGTNVPGGMMGVGGSPGSSVYVKAGILTNEPTIKIESEYYRTDNFDKANQSQSGKDMKIITNMEKPAGDFTDDFAYKTAVYHFIARTNENGEVFLTVGTDSGFEATTIVYYDNLKLYYKEATPYNLSVVQESYYSITSEYIELDNGVTIGIPKAIGFINAHNEETINAIINKEISDITGKFVLTRLYSNYTVKGDLLSITLNGAYETEGEDFSFFDSINIDMKNYELIKTEDFVKQDVVSFERFNQVFKEELKKKGLNDEISFNNSMNIFYESEFYLISYLAKDTDTRDTLIYIFEDELEGLLNY